MPREQKLADKVKAGDAFHLMILSQTPMKKWAACRA